MYSILFVSQVQIHHFIRIINYFQTVTHACVPKLACVQHLLLYSESPCDKHGMPRITP